jgi:protein TonB|nr:energy transducer TonB [uncultured Pseudoxanthomonas sp.]
MKAKRMWLGVGLLLCLAGCQGASSPDAKQGGTASPVAADIRLDEAVPATPYARATQALAENRMLAPAGDNAVEHYLAARVEAGERTRAQAALSELQPYVLIAAEQAIARGDAGEAKRLQGLIERIDGQAPALPRLKAGVAALLREQALQAAAPDQEAVRPAASRMSSTGEALPAQAMRAPVPASTLAAAPAVVAPPPAPLATRQEEAPATSPSVVPSRVVQEIRTPRLLQDAQPRYPLPALRARVEGQAEVAFTIQPDGSVRDVRLVSSTPAGMFDAPALAVAQRWRFEATGQAHASRRTVRFQLPAPGSSDG